MTDPLITALLSAADWESAATYRYDYGGGSDDARRSRDAARQRRHLAIERLGERLSDLDAIAEILAAETGALGMDGHVETCADALRAVLGVYRAIRVERDAAVARMSAVLDAADGTLTVGAALADPRVQGGSHVVEFRGSRGWWRQVRVGRYGDEAHGYDRGWLGEAWGEWDVSSIEVPALTLPARVILCVDCDRSPVSP